MYGDRLTNRDNLDDDALGLSSDFLDLDDDANVQALVALNSKDDL